MLNELPFHAAEYGHIHTLTLVYTGDELSGYSGYLKEWPAAINEADRLCRPGARRA